MAGVWDVVMVSVLILLAVIVALTRLAPKSLRRRLLGSMAGLARRLPGGEALAVRLDAASVTSGGCGGCNSCEPAAAGKSAEVGVPLSQLRRRR